MTYLKDIKLCINCQFYGNQHGQKDRCINPKVTVIDLVDGKEEYPYCYAQRKVTWEGKTCGEKGDFYVPSEDAVAQEMRRQEFEEAMRDAPF